MAFGTRVPVSEEALFVFVGVAVLFALLFVPRTGDDDDVPEGDD